MTNFKNVAVGRLKRKMMDDLSFEQVINALEALGNAKKAGIVNAVKLAKKEQVGRRVLDAVAARILDDADDQVDSLMQDGSLTEAELEILFGGKK